jgi:hypothetical protein
MVVRLYLVIRFLNLFKYSIYQYSIFYITQSYIFSIEQIVFTYGCKNKVLSMKKEKNVCGKRIKVARVIKDMAQIDLAVALNVDFEIDINQNGVSQLERGMRQVKDSEIIALASVLEINPLWILYGDDVPEEYK